jgi:O-antigen ligase
MWGIQQKLAGNSRMEGLGGAILMDINLLSAVYVLYFPLTYYSIFSKNKFVRSFIGIPSFVIFVVFILFGSSRGAFLGMAVCLMYIFMKAKGLQKIKMIATSVVLVVLLGLTLSQLAPEGFFDEYTERLGTIFGKEDESTGEVEREGSSAGRVAMWKGVLQVMKNHPEYWFTGVGIDCYKRTYIRHIDEIAEVLEPEELGMVMYGGKGGKQIHNTYLGLLSGGGLAVTLPWLILTFYGWFHAHRIPKKYPKIVDGIDIHNYAKGVEVGIVGYCLCIMFVNMEVIDFYYWFLAMSGIIANIGKAKLKREKLGLEDEEFEEEPQRKTGYAPYAY